MCVCVCVCVCWFRAARGYPNKPPECKVTCRRCLCILLADFTELLLGQHTQGLCVCVCVYLCVRGCVREGGDKTEGERGNLLR